MLSWKKHTLKHRSIGDTLTLIIMAVSGTSVLLALIAMTVFGVTNLRAKLMDEWSLVAAVMADRSASTIIADDPITAKQLTRRILEGRQSVWLACLYSGNKEFAFFQSPQAEHIGCPSTPPSLEENHETKGQQWIAEGKIHVSQPIVNKGKTVGYAYIMADQLDVWVYMYRQMAAALVVLGVALVASYILAKYFQRSITEPLGELSDISRKVAEAKDFSLRVPGAVLIDAHPENEIGKLFAGFNAVLEEIDRREQALQSSNLAMKTAKLAAETANRSKTEFLANISHELRTPLNAIIGFSEMIKGQMFGPVGVQKYLDYATDIYDSGNHLLRIINDILDITRAEAGLLSFEEKPLNLSRTLETCIRMMQEQAERNGVEIINEVPRDLAPIMGDYHRFKQIALNLLSNAIKFTLEGGSVTVKAKIAKSSAGTPELVVSIVDTGIGMAPEDIPTALKSFGQVDGGLNRRFEGAGLGLPLAKKLVEMHEGRLEIETEKGQGTTIHVIIPGKRMIVNYSGEDNKTSGELA